MRPRLLWSGRWSRAILYPRTRRVTPAVLVGIVDAPDADTTIKNAIEEHQITNFEEQNRLVAQRRE
jgi:hypothetical protein